MEYIIYDKSLIASIC